MTVAALIAAERGLALRDVYERLQESLRGALLGSAEVGDPQHDAGPS